MTTTLTTQTTIRRVATATAVHDERYADVRDRRLAARLATSSASTR